MTSPGAVLVTGATGFLGSHVVHRLVADGYEVHTLARPSSSFHRLTAVTSRLTQWTAEATDTEAIAHACRASEALSVIHCAGDTSTRKQDEGWAAWDRAMTVNLHGTLALLRAAAGTGSKVRTLIRFGGLEEYGTAPTPWTEAQREQPTSPYSASQVAATHACAALQSRLPFALVTLRPALLYGPRQSTDFLIPALITALLRRERFAMTDGAQCRDFLYVDDVVDAVFRAMARPDLRAAVFNISSGREWPLREVAHLVADQLSAGSLLDLGAHPARAGDLRHMVADNSYAARELDWHPRVAFADGLAKTIAWYRVHHRPENSP